MNGLIFETSVLILQRSVDGGGGTRLRQAAKCLQHRKAKPMARRATPILPFLLRFFSSLREGREREERSAASSKMPGGHTRAESADEESSTGNTNHPGSSAASKQPGD
ncbi:hypothetical protein BDZ45DRAFT_747496 [Acephala macrosclerotiorum]|nr:hypothetical protein BDZ45DRAFT_747496 [Acephala macrosclerotiorum]